MVDKFYFALFFFVVLYRCCQKSPEIKSKNFVIFQVNRFSHCFHRISHGICFLFFVFIYWMERVLQNLLFLSIENFGNNTAIDIVRFLLLYFKLTHIQLKIHSLKIKWAVKIKYHCIMRLMTCYVYTWMNNQLFCCDMLNRFSSVSKTIQKWATRQKFFFTNFPFSSS